MKDTVEEERRTVKKEILRAEEELAAMRQKYDARLFLIKNRLVMLCQGLKVWLPRQDLDAEEILKEMIRSIKENSQQLSIE